jgi:hypothetical protein
LKIKYWKIIYKRFEYGRKDTSIFKSLSESDIFQSSISHRPVSKSTRICTFSMHTLYLMLNMLRINVLFYSFFFLFFLVVWWSKIEFFFLRMWTPRKMNSNKMYYFSTFYNIMRESYVVIFVFLKNLNYFLLKLFFFCILNCNFFSLKIKFFYILDRFDALISKIIF